MRYVAISLVIVLLSVQTVAALPDPGITPDNFLYNFKRLFERIELAFVFDDVVRSEKYLNFAELRLAEAKSIAEQRPELVGGLIQEYQTNIDTATELADKAKQLRDTTELENLIKTARSEHIEVLNEVVIKVPEVTKIIIRDVIAREMEKIDSIKIPVDIEIREPEKRDPIPLIQEPIIKPTEEKEIDPKCGNDICDIDETSLSCPGDCGTQTRCIDSDLGLNYYNKGSVSGFVSGTRTYTTKVDSCDNNRLTEYRCNGVYITESILPCSYGCFDGACKLPPSITGGIIVG